MKKNSIFVCLFVVSCLPFGSTVIAAEVDHNSFTENAQCYECHGYKELTVENEGETLSLFVDKNEYEASVHGTIDCISCHEFTGSYEYGDALRETVSATCDDCHTGAGFDYERSVHQESAEGPNCVDCHGAHAIPTAVGSLSPVAGKNLDETCGDCHPKVITSYRESFHGKAVALGAKNAPDCTTCHGSHQVLGSDDPVALTSVGQKTSLCADCHPGQSLGVGAVQHYTMKASGYGAPMYWVKKVFMWLILFVVGFFLIHIEFDLWHKLRMRKL